MLHLGIFQPVLNVQRTCNVIMKIDLAVTPRQVHFVIQPFILFDLQRFFLRSRLLLTLAFAKQHSNVFF